MTRLAHFLAPFLVLLLVGCAGSSGTISQQQGMQSQSAHLPQSGYSIEVEFAYQTEDCAEGINLKYNCNLHDFVKTNRLYILDDEILSYMESNNSTGGAKYIAEDIRFPFSGKFRRTRTYNSELGPTKEAFWASGHDNNITLHNSGVANRNSQTYKAKFEYRIHVMGKTCEMEYFEDSESDHPQDKDSILATSNVLKFITRPKWTETISCNVTPGNAFE